MAINDFSLKINEVAKLQSDSDTQTIKCVMINIL
jgi:hypothetical protein